MNELVEAEVYADITIRWKNEDFSQADQDHNSVWKLLDAEIGKATGLISETSILTESEITFANSSV